MANRAATRPLIAAALAMLALGACVPRAEPPASAPAPVAISTPAAAPASLPPYRPPPPPRDWQTAPLSPGDWTYNGSTGAIFRSPGMLNFAVRCQGNEILIRVVAQGEQVAITTSFGQRRLAAPQVNEREVEARLPASDPLLDQMAFSRGRFLVIGAGGPPMVIPSWPEIGRVIEDCRGQ